jgi:hypothetical protein
MLLRTVFPFLFAAALFGQKYNGPQPEKPDLPYLVHGDHLVATEVSEAKENSRKGEVLEIVEGSTSPVATPLASPIFLIRTDKLNAEQLELYKLESKNGHREVLVSRKNKPAAKPFTWTVSRVGDDLYKLEVDKELPNGEYSITPRESQQVFCFRVY